MSKAVPSYREAARRVHAFLQEQVGKPYIFGAHGPDEWDCSGLVSAAWGTVGVTLTPYTARMFEETTYVPLSPLTWRPGDLLFYYTDHGHVATYVGLSRWRHRIVIAATDETHGVERLAYDHYLRPSAARRVIWPPAYR